MKSSFFSPQILLMFFLDFLSSFIWGGVFQIVKSFSLILLLLLLLLLLMLYLFLSRCLDWIHVVIVLLPIFVSTSIPKSPLSRSPCIAPPLQHLPNPYHLLPLPKPPPLPLVCIFPSGPLISEMLISQLF